MAHDRGLKLYDYRRIPSVQEIVLIASEQRHTEVWRRQGAKWERLSYLDYARAGEGQLSRFSTAPGTSKGSSCGACRRPSAPASRSTASATAISRQSRRPARSACSPTTFSSGLEPVFAWRYERKLLNQDGTSRTFALADHAWRRWRELDGPCAPLPPAFRHAHEIPPKAHLAVQAALQPHVDSSISMTINVPEDYAFAAFKDIYRRAYEQGLKGCTTFRPNPITGEILKGAEDGTDAPHCCAVEREAD
jgi:hypothetical protein